MQQKLYIQIRSRTSLWAERAKTSRMPTMATSTFFETVKHNNPLTSSQSLLLCSQVKADATETLIQMCSRTSLWAERAKRSRVTTMATCTCFESVNQQSPLTSHQPLLIYLQVRPDATGTLHAHALANIIANRAREHIKEDQDVNTHSFWKRQPQKPANQPSIIASLFAGSTWCDRNSIYKCFREHHCEQSARKHQGWPRCQYEQCLKMSNAKTR